MEKSSSTTWPVLRRYDQSYLRQIAMPIGGIGTGTISLGGRGDLRDWEIVNRPAKGFAPRHSFFALYTEDSDGNRTTRALEGIIAAHDAEGSTGCPIANPGLPRFDDCHFDAAYPCAQVHLHDRAVPLQVTLQAFNPLVPANVDASSLPVAILRYRLQNPHQSPVTAAICGTVQNFIGTDGTDGDSRDNRNRFCKQDSCHGLVLEAPLDPNAATYGTMALMTPSDGDISARTAWRDWPWGDALLDFWDDFSHDGSVTEREQGNNHGPFASLCVRTTVPANASRDVVFIIAWHFPNRQSWSTASGCSPDPPETIGNHYCQRFADAWEAACYASSHLPDLESETLRFVNALVTSDMPEVIKEAALFNLTALRSQTAFRTPDGYLFGWEGTHRNTGCCHGSCTHVWNYEQATAWLFGDLAKGMREVEFLHATNDQGLMSFRVELPLHRARAFASAAADGQLGCIMKMYREWQLSGDDEWLKRLWPAVRNALAFCWIPGGWDADRDGVMEGCQHNTMDVEYFGPNPQMQGWYLGALRAAASMAEAVGEATFAEECRQLAANGKAFMDEQLFNGEYYEQLVQLPNEGDEISEGLHHTNTKLAGEPESQLGDGCLVDQLVGQLMAHVCNLGHVVDSEHVSSALTHVHKYNFRSHFRDHFNNMRSYVMADERGLLMATYPRGDRPQRPFMYFNEVMPGFEYTAAIGMMFEGQMSTGLACMEAIRARYDGARRNPFNEAECGNHYARSMVAWAAIQAWTGFGYSAVTGTMTMERRQGKQFWSTGYAWGTFEQVEIDGNTKVTCRVHGGRLKLARIEFRDGSGQDLSAATQLGAGNQFHLLIEAPHGCLV